MLNILLENDVKDKKAVHHHVKFKRWYLCVCLCVCVCVYVCVCSVCTLGIYQSVTYTRVQKQTETHIHTKRDLYAVSVQPVECNHRRRDHRSVAQERRCKHNPDDAKQGQRVNEPRPWGV